MTKRNPVTQHIHSSCIFGNRELFFPAPERTGQSVETTKFTPTTLVLKTACYKHYHCNDILNQSDSKQNYEIMEIGPIQIMKILNHPKSQMKNYKDD